MNKGLTNYEIFKVVRPIFDEFNLDEFDMPVMHKVEKSSLDLPNINPTNLQNLKKGNNNNKLVFPFNYDKVLKRYWDDPLKYIPLFQTVMGIGTPDFSIYENMNPNQIRTNVYQNRWLGCTWQHYGINAIPTIGWALPDTYDICFSGIEKNSVVMISTIGCQNNKDLFMQGFCEMKHRLNPSLIIVYGKMLPEMTGKFINFTYSECFNDNVKFKTQQMKLFELSPVFKITEDFVYGI